MKKYTFILFAIILSALTVKAQEGDLAAEYASSITVEDLTKYLTVIASDEFQGRETGEKGLDLAAEYIVKQLKEFGIAPVPSLGSYYQPVAYKKVSWGDVTVNANGKEFKNMRDFYSFASLNESMAEIKAKKVMFLGYGIDDEKYSDYEGVDVKDKVLVVYPGEPKNQDEKYWISGTSKKSKWNWRRKLKVAKEKGAKLVMFIEPNTLKNINRYGRWLIEPSFGLYKPDEPSKYANHMFISPTMLKTILGKKKYKKLAKANNKITKTGKSVNFKARSRFKASMNKKSEKLISNNILAFIEGSDDEVKDEVVVVTAHYDHVGYRGEDIFNGADDDGSGTTALMEMAQAFQAAKKAGNGTRRSVLLLWVAGEEKGLLGSKYYTDNPVFPLENTVADVNIDMIGRVDKKYEKANNPNYIYVIGSDRLSTDLHKINEEANKKYTQLTLDYTYNDENDPNRYYYRSDHYNFAKNGIPSIFFFNGTHADYHKSTDTIEKINFAKMQKIVTLIFHTTWELANRDERIKVDVEQKP
jgi:Zn-dependent M28 family amino/carboxypeptidase